MVVISLKKRIMLVAVILSILIGLGFLNSPESFPGKRGLRSFLMKKLVKSEPVPAAYQKPESESKNVIYVLGGSPRSLENRFYIAADLYKRGYAKKIWVDSGEILMDYRNDMGRNITYNEWVVEKLTILGVSKQDIEPILIEKGFFGTYSEAKSVSGALLKRDYKGLILVSSREHTMRVWNSFSKFMKNSNFNLYIYPSLDSPGIPVLLQEFLKLQLYRTLLL